MKISRVKSRFLFWLRGYVVVPNFLQSYDSIEIRKYVESVNFSSGNCKLPHGSLCSFSNGEVFDFQKCRFDNQIQMSLVILNGITNERFSDVGLRSIQLRMHSPVWHIDMQTFNDDKPLIARDRRFKVYKCGVYLQDESVDGGGTLEVRQPYAGGGIKNFLYTGNYKKQDTRVIHLFVKALGAISDSLQIFGKSLGLKEGDLVIFSGALKHRASQKKHDQSVLQDLQSGYFVDMSDKVGKIMLQWEFVNESVFGYEYRNHAILKHKLIK